jgi:hypothetical protein
MNPKSAPPFLHGGEFLPQFTDGCYRFSNSFQAKMSELVLALELVRTYWDDLLCITDALISVNTKGQKGTKTHKNTQIPYFDKSSALISN